MLTKNIALALSLTAGIALAATSAFADEQENAAGCRHMSKAVSSALEANASATNYQHALAEQDAGQKYCQVGLFGEGISHYANALKLLGVSN
jgi:hypothetical protein